LLSWRKDKKDTDAAQQQKRMRYTEQQKADALKLVDEIGATKASEQLSVSYATLLAWRKHRTVDVVPTDPVHVAGEKITAPRDDDQPLEAQVRMLKHEVAQLKAQLVRQSKAIQALSSIEE
jgi:transposase-like protein